MAEHRDLPNNLLHEPKGVDTAADGEVYVANGVGGGSWIDVNLVNPHNTVAYADKTLIGDGITGIDINIVAAVDATLRTLDDYESFTHIFTPDLTNGITIDVDGNFVIATSGIYQFNMWLSEENTMSKSTLGITFYKNQLDATNLIGPVGGPVLRDKTKDLGGGEPAIDDLTVTGLLDLTAGDVIGIAVACVSTGVFTVFDGSISMILLEDLS